MNKNSKMTTEELAKERIKRKIILDSKNCDYYDDYNYMSLSDIEWNALLDNLYIHFKKLDKSEIFYDRIMRVIYQSLKENFFTSIEHVDIRDILLNLNLLNPEMFDYEELTELKNKIIEEIKLKLYEHKIKETEKVIDFKKYLGLRN